MRWGDNNRPPGIAAALDRITSHHTVHRTAQTARCLQQSCLGLTHEEANRQVAAEATRSAARLDFRRSFGMVLPPRWRFPGRFQLATPSDGPALVVSTIVEFWIASSAPGGMPGRLAAFGLSYRCILLMRSFK